MFNCSRTKFEAIIVNVFVLYMQSFCLTLLRFYGILFDFWTDFSNFQFFVFDS